MVALIDPERGDPDRKNRTLSSKTYASCINSLWCSEKCLRQAFEFEATCFAMVSLDGRLLRANAALCQMLGYTEEELKQTGLDSLIHPDDINRAQDIVLWANTGEISYAEFEKRYLCRNGIYLWVRIATDMFCSDSGTPMYFVSQIENISKQKQAEEALLQKELEYRSLVENSPDAISRYDLEGRLIYANRQFDRLVTRTSAGLLGHRTDEECFADVEFGRQFCQKINQVLKDKEPIEFEISSRNTDGATWYHLIRLVPEFDIEENLDGVLAFGTDITRQKQAEDALRQRELEYRSIVKNSPDMITRYDRTGNRIYVNPQFEKLTGRSASELLGRRPDQTGYADTKFGQLFTRNVDQVIKDKAPISFETSFRYADGRIRYDQIKLVPEFDISGQLVGVLGFGSEITATKQAQYELEKNKLLLHTVMDNIPQAIFWKDSNLTYLGCNRAFAEDAGLVSPDEIVGKTDYELPWFPQAELYRADDKLVLDSGRAKLNYEEPQTTPGRGQIWLRTNKIPMWDAEENVNGVLGTYEDITERKQMELILQENQKRLFSAASIAKLGYWDYNEDIDMFTFDDNLYAVLHTTADVQGGYQMSPAEFIKRFLHPDDVPLIIDAFNKALTSSGSEYNAPLEYRVRYTDQGIGHVQVLIRVLRDDEGRIILHAGTTQDITERKLAEREQERLLTEIRNSQVLLRSVIDTTPDWIFIKDSEHRYRMVNQGYADALHISPEDFIGKDDLELGFTEELVKGNPEKGIRGFWIDDRLVMDSGQMQVYPNDPATIDGKVHVFHTIKSPLKQPDGQVWGVLAFARDITQVKKSNERLEMVTNALERVDMPVLINDGTGRLIYVNPKACQTLGYNNSELLAMDITQIDLGVDSSMVETLYSYLLPGQLKFFKHVSKHVDKSGHVFPVEVTVTIYNWQGKNFGISLIRDLSNQYQNDEMLIQAEQDFMILVENSPDIIVRYNRFMKCIYVNRTWETVTGFPQFDMLDKTPSGNSYLPVEAARGIEMVIDQVIQTRKGVQRSFVLPHASTGKLVHLLVDVVPELGINGNLSGIMVVARNITELEAGKDLLNRRQAILEEAQQLGHIGSWELDLVNNTREWSKETYRIFEMDPDIITPSNDAFMRLVHPDDLERVDKIYCELGRTRNDYEVELRLLFPDGRVKYVNERGITQFDDNGKPKRYLGSVQDITRWKVQQLELLHAKELALESSRLKSSFLAMMSHEMRTPLNAILGFSSLIKDNSLTIGERNEFIGLVELGAERLTSAIDSMIELSKLVSGDIKISPETYSPDKIIRQHYKELKELCRKTGKEKLILKIRIASQLEKIIFVSDAARIKQTINILIDNAVKYTKSGEIILGVKFSGNDLVTFYVSDTGIGVPPEKQQIIFDLFVQSEDSYKRNYEGLGIGLSAARKIARALGGDITLVSEPGKGSVFSFTIPIDYAKGARM